MEKKGEVIFKEVSKTPLLLILNPQKHTQSVNQLGLLKKSFIVTDSLYVSAMRNGFASSYFGKGKSTPLITHIPNDGDLSEIFSKYPENKTVFFIENASFAIKRDPKSTSALAGSISNNELFETVFFVWIYTSGKKTLFLKLHDHYQMRNYNIEDRIRNNFRLALNKLYKYNY